jgi:hypothetical protein
MLNVTEREIVAPEIGLPISEEDWDGRNRVCAWASISRPRMIRPGPFVTTPGFS